MTYSSSPIRLANLTGTTPFPNYLLDTVMPTLTDTQWRLLCVVVRQTLGWQVRGAGQSQTGQRKSADWLTHCQLKLRTGRSSATVSRALDALVRRNLLEVRDSRQQPLLTAQSRQRYGGRLYFRLGPAVLAHILRDYPATAWPTGLDTQQMGQAAHEGGKGFLETGFYKVRTTKAIPTKYLSNDKEPAPPGSASGLENPSRSAAAGGLPNPDVTRFLSAYARLFRQQTLSGDPPALAWGRDGKIVRELLKLYSYERLEQLLPRFFESRDAWLVRRGYSLPAFKGAINGLLASEQDRGDATTTRRSHQPVLRTGRWSKAGETGGFQQRQQPPR